MERFIRGVSDLYQPNPYHNFTHAFATYHVLSLLLADLVPFIDGERADAGEADLAPKTPKASERPMAFSDVDRTAALLAALGHDAGHRGRTNAYEVNSESDLALRYNDQAVLENHHASVTCTLALALMENTALEDRKRIKSVIVQSILATDMGKHGSQLAWIRSKTQNSFFRW